MTSDSKPSGKLAHLHTIKKIIEEVIRYKPSGILPIVVGTIITNILRGFGIMMLIPGISLLSENPPKNKLTDMFFSAFQNLGIELNLQYFLLCIVILITISILIERYINIKINCYQVEMKQHVRQKLFSRIMEMNWKDFSNYNTSEFLRLVDSEINQFSRSANNIFKFIINILQTSAYLVVAAIISWKITIAMMLVGLSLLLISMSFNREILQHSKHNNASRSAIYQASLDIFNNFKFAKVQGLESVMNEDFAVISKEESGQNMKIFEASANTSAITKILSVIALALFIWIAIHWFSLQTSALLVILFIAIRVLGFAAILQRNWQLIIMGVPSFNNITKILNKDGFPATFSQNNIGLKQHISFRDVFYQHDNIHTIDNANFQIPANKITVIVGKSGSGKTTLIDLISGIITPQSGTITIDDTALDQDTINTWRKKIAYLPQDTPLFSGTVRENFKYAHHIMSDDDIWQALENANAKTTVEKLPQQLDTILGQNGAFISGGEKQRIALARAMSAEPDLLILDEPTSAQDYINEREIQHYLNTLKANTTVIIIAHKKDIIKQADIILLVDSGKISTISDTKEIVQHPELQHLL